MLYTHKDGTFHKWHINVYKKMGKEMQNGLSYQRLTKREHSVQLVVTIVKQRQ